MPELYRPVSLLPTWTPLARYIAVKALARGDGYTELILSEPLRDSPTVKATLEAQSKAAIAPGRTRIAHSPQRSRSMALATKP